jgi:hypothetical protein
MTDIEEVDAAWDRSGDIGARFARGEPYPPAMRFVIDLALTATEAGGRRGGIEVGYRPTWDNGDRTDDGSVHYHDASIVAMAVKRLEPGERTTAEIVPHWPDAWEHVAAGAELRMCEGPRQVGVGVVRSRGLYKSPC